MARTLTTSYTAPFPPGHVAGLPMWATYAPDAAIGWDKFTEAVNFTLAHHANKPVVSQGWGDDLCQQTANPFTQACTWKIPQLTDRHTTVSVYVRCDETGGVGGGNGRVRFQSAEAAGTLTLDAPSAEGLVSGSLTVGADGDGYDVITMAINGDGTNPTIVHSVHIQYEDLTSPLDITINGVPVWDINEVATQRPLTVAKGRRLLAQLNEALARRQVYYNWSGIENSTNSNATWAMENYLHEVPVPAHMDTETQDRKLRAHVYASGITGVTSDVVIRHGGRPINPADKTSFTVAVAAPAAWYDPHGGDIPATIQPPQPDRGTPLATAIGWLGVWPGEESTANVHSVMIEGV